MKRMVVLIDSKFKQNVCALLAMNRVQYSMSTDSYIGEVRVSLPHSKGVRFLAELRRFYIPYELM